MKRNSIVLFLVLFSFSFLYAQTLKKEFPSEQKIDVIENLGAYIPLDTIFINEMAMKLNCELFSIRKFQQY